MAMDGTSDPMASEISFLVREGEEALFKGELHKALELFLRMRSLDPNDCRAHAYIASTQFALGRITESMSSFAEAIELLPDLENVGICGLTLMGLADHELASKVFSLFCYPEGQNREEIFSLLRNYTGPAQLGEYVYPHCSFGDPLLTPPRKLRVFSDRRFLPPGMPPSEILYPLWDFIEETPHVQRGCFERYVKIGSNFFELASLENSDFAFFPTQWNSKFRDLALEFSNIARSAGKPLVIIKKSDCSEEVDIPNSIVFQTSLYRCNQRANEFALPSQSEDLVARYLGSVLPIRNKSEIPTISFCGRPIGEPFHPRDVAIASFFYDDSIKKNFIIRNGYWALVNDKEPLRSHLFARLEYVHNMVYSDYAFCCRGSGNFSFRLYEALSLGRIPLFLDTNCVLPYDDIIDWKKYVLWIEYEDMFKISQSTKELHNLLSDDEFIDRQYKCRKLWEEWLNPIGFYSNLWRRFSPNG